MSSIIKSRFIDYPASEQSRPRLDFLDGMRAVAALFVFFGHLWGSQFGVVDGIKGLAVNWLCYPHLAVDVFIILSGYCLVLPVAKTGTLLGGASKFFGRRAKRILPPYYAALLLSIMTAVFLKHFGHYHNAPWENNPLSLRTILINIFLLQDIWNRADSLDPPMWSIALEWQIYFLFPIFVHLLLRYGNIAVLAISSVLGYGFTLILLYVNPYQTLERNCPWYLFLFAMGICAGAWVFTPSNPEKNINGIHKTRIGAILSICALAVILYLFPQTKAAGSSFAKWTPITDALCGTFTACSLILLTRDPSQVKWMRIFSTKPLIFLGAYSYSLYLVHVPILYLVRGTVSRLLVHHHSPIVVFSATAMVGIPVVIAGSYIFHLIFERPFMSRSPRTEYQAELSAIVSPAP